MFTDHFSRRAESYARFRPHYPSDLFAYLAAVAPGTDRVWDCGTGSGQAAVALAERFARVVASDPSRAQVRYAVRAARVRYLVGVAEAAPLASASVDLVVAAQALHWFDVARFHREAARVARPRGVIAVWSYGAWQADEPIRTVLERFYRETVGPYWLPERAIVDAGYANLPFPFDELSPPVFRMEAYWTLDELCGYASTWSAVQRYQDAVGSDPVAGLREELRSVWGDAATPRTVRWPLRVRVGRTG
jgi:SAM-dependent methyltransferase